MVPSGTVVDCLVAHLPRVLRGCSSGGADGRNSSLSLTEGDVECVKLHVYDCAKYLAELSVSVPALCLVYRPSVVSYASVLVRSTRLSSGGPPPPPLAGRRVEAPAVRVRGRRGPGVGGVLRRVKDGGRRWRREDTGGDLPEPHGAVPDSGPGGRGGCASNKNDNDEALLLSPTTSATVV